jgi:hypothetical protein
MCDSGCEITFTATHVSVKHGTSKILSVKYGLETGLWWFKITVTPPAPATPPNNVYEKRYLQATIPYLHAACFSTVQDIRIKSIDNGNFAT